MSGRRKTVGLALGGGVVRGLAHVGVLNVLDAAGIPIDMVAGASAGSLVGAAYAAGLGMERIRDLAWRVRWRHIVGLTWPLSGLLSFNRLERWVAQIIGNVTFADLNLPFAVVAADLESGQPVYLRQGRVAEAVRVSCTVPGAVRPRRLNGRLLADGSLVDTVPVSILRKMGADYIIGVEIFRPRLRGWWGPPGYGLAALEILLSRAGGGVESADCLITPALEASTYIHFSHGPRLVSLGEQAAWASLPKLRADLEL